MASKSRSMAVSGAGFIHSRKRASKANRHVCRERYKQTKIVHFSLVPTLEEHHALGTPITQAAFATMIDLSLIRVACGSQSVSSEHLDCPFSDRQHNHAFTQLKAKEKIDGDYTIRPILNSFIVAISTDKGKACSNYKFGQ